MAKKNVGGGALSGRALDWIGNEPTPAEAPEAPTAPAKRKTARKKAATTPKPEPAVEWVRKTYLIRSDHIESINAFAFQTKRKKKDVVEEALTQYFKDKDVINR